MNKKQDMSRRIVSVAIGGMSCLWQHPVDGVRDYSRLKASAPMRQLGEFLANVNMSKVFPVSLTVLMRAADLCAEATKAGHPHNDADLIIAATALEAKRTLVTGNTAHYFWTKDLRLANWRDLVAAA